MTVRTILTQENPLLRRKAVKVTRFSKAVRQLVDDMFETLDAAGGVGLAAPQIGVLQRVFVVGLPAEYDDDGNEISPQEDYVLINPEIIFKQGEEELVEGCLSIPGYQGLVRRATSVVIKGQDEYGRPVRYSGEGLLAQAFQHELDHLDGVLYIDHLDSQNKFWAVEQASEEDAEDSAD
ncbi:MAG: peptide deformylase [Anaerolineae bacterium]|jgi:peptide deformylase|nr:peptide deformylase [Chloroflexota bacterium]